MFLKVFDRYQTRRQGTGLAKLLLLLLLLSTNSIAKINTVYVCSPYKSAPFIIDAQQRLGLIYTFTDFLNQQAQGAYHFEVLILPRARLLKTLAMSTDCIVPFVSHQWFDPDKQQYYWSQAIIKDANVILSRHDLKLESIAKAQVSGLITSQVIGFLDGQIEALVAAGNLVAVNATSLEQSVKMLASQRIDFLVSGQMPLQYLVQKLQLQDQLYISNNATLYFDRAVLIAKSKPRLSTFIEQKISDLKAASHWQNTLQALGINN
ncbi:hypothetical protein SAMN05216262_102317 [Colwellia chukchiensis]|uniref:Solute-binding protein family 3/N-terminal domain-containing protein n=1 Tax=Colwellia chukchiensis TaxID=641665 RepID=A0A1H7JQN7_9GAMM|nr:hypothetical protein [Colwellia chukchiensis]SEK76714.1 hypothetical protein SAMN05216262_102317 [Colwellia chukchiensis]